MLEFLLVAGLVLAATVLILRTEAVGRLRAPALAARRWLPRVVAGVGTVAAAGAAIWYVGAYASHSQRSYIAGQTPERVLEHGYVSAAACKSCHPGHFETWHKTYHRTMTQAASPEAVQGDFSDQTVVIDEVEYYLFRRGNAYWARTTPVGSMGQRGTATEVELVMTTGSHHYQVYWTGEGPDRSLVEFPLAWLIADRRWIPREAALIMPPHLKQQTVLWNGICIRCHSTHSQPRIELATGHANTATVDLGISCEACHGPGEEHVRANSNPLRRYAQHLQGGADATIVNPSRLSAEHSSQACGQCHSIASFSDSDWHGGHWNEYRPGEDLHSGRNVIQLSKPESLKDIRGELEKNHGFLAGRYWGDGMVRVSGREYNGLIESPCYQGGKLSCLSCHSMHASHPDDQLAPRMQADHACLQCHGEYQDKIAEHTHHGADSAGSRCYNCHMPHTTYGLLKAIRSHQVSSPRVSETQNHGRPNACNQCHLNKTLQWTNQHLNQWYAAPAETLDADQSQVSSMALLLLRGDAGQRALAAWSMGWDEARKASGDRWQAPYLAQLLDDPYPAVRYIALRSLRRLPGYQDFDSDFIGSAGQRRQSRQRALEIWDRQIKTRLDQTGPAVLIDAQGRLDSKTLDRLLQQRDDRDIDLQE